MVISPNERHLLKPYMITRPIVRVSSTYLSFLLIPVQHPSWLFPFRIEWANH